MVAFDSRDAYRIYVDEKNIITDVNNLFLEDLNVKKDQIIGKCLSEFFEKCPKKEGIYTTFATVFNKKFLSIVKIEKKDGRKEILIKNITKYLEELSKDSSVGVVFLTPELRIGYINSFFEKSLKIDIRNAIGKHCYSVVKSLDKQCGECKLMDALRYRKVVEFEERIREDFLARKIIFPIIIDGEVLGALTFVIDITLEKYKMEELKEELKKSERKYKELFENAGDAIILIDETGKIVDANKEANSLFGCNVVGRSIFEFTTDYSRKKVLNSLKLTFANRCGEELLRFDIIDAYGNKKTVDGRCRVLSTAECKLAHLILRDITSLIALQNELKSQKEFLESIINGIDDGIVVIGKDMEILLANNSFYSMYRLNKENMDKNIIYDVINGKLLDIILKNRRLMVVTKRTKVNGDTKYVRIKIYPFKENMIIEVHEDITNIFRLRKRIAEYYRKLKEAYNELKDVDFLKSSIITNVSHELKTPITIIKGVIDILLNEVSEKEHYELLKVAKKGIIRLSKIIEDLITIAKITKGDYEITPILFGIKEIINETLAEKNNLLKEKNIKVKLNVEDVKVYADQNLIKHMLMNLLDNAIKFNKKNGEIYINAYEEDGYVIISIKDTGIGIPKDKIDKIFEPFFQVDPSIRRKYGGTGLGLAIVKRIVDLHGGKIEVKSVLGKGSEFIIKIPKRIKKN